MTGPLLRAPILWLAERRWMRRLVTRTGVGRLVALRFVAGETIEDGLASARRLGKRRIAAMLDHLGENVTNEEQASAAADAYVLALKRIAETDALDCNISIKLTQLGLDLSVDRCLENAERVLAAAEELGSQVMIDMEAHAYVDGTLRVVRELRRSHGGVGVALQSYLYRTADDVFALPEATPVRLVKGAYLEPRTVAFPHRRDVDRNYARLFVTLVARGHEVHVATHDPALLEGARLHVERNGIPWDRVEFQMLYGIRRDLQHRYASEGYPMRTYIPYGDQWYPYLVRRLAERPANLWFFLSNLLRWR